MKVTMQRWRVMALAFGVVAGSAIGQSPATPPGTAATLTTPAAPAAAPPEAVPVAPAMLQFDWLHGCWDGKVNMREFREEWLPLRSEVMVGTSQTVLGGKSQDVAYLRLELRADGVYYVAASPGKSESAFHLSGKTTDGDDEIFTFENPAGAFPQRIVYRKGTKGWLYAEVQGTISGQERKVIYPMRRVNCQSGDLIEN